MSADADPDLPRLPAEPTEVRAVQARWYRDVLGRFCTGITVVTAASGGEPVGLTCQAFTSVSLEPPLVLFCPSRTSRAWPTIQATGGFCANFLAADQAALSDTMAGKGTDKFAGVGWSPSAYSGAPVLDGVLGYVDCSIEAVHEAGDHWVVIGRVQHLASFATPTEPLLFYAGRYRAMADDGR